MSNLDVFLNKLGILENTFKNIGLTWIKPATKTDEKGNCKIIYKIDNVSIEFSFLKKNNIIYCLIKKGSEQSFLLNDYLGSVGKEPIPLFGFSDFKEFKDYVQMYLDVLSELIISDLKGVFLDNKWINVRRDYSDYK